MKEALKKHFCRWEESEKLSIVKFDIELTTSDVSRQFSILDDGSTHGTFHNHGDGAGSPNPECRGHFASRKCCILGAGEEGFGNFQQKKKGG